MADLNLRGIDPALKARLKINAAATDQTLAEYCFAVLRVAAVPLAGVAQSPATKLIRTPADVKRLVTGIRNGKKVTEELHISKSCTSCGALNGMHFRGCKA